MKTKNARFSKTGVWKTLTQSFILIRLGVSNSGCSYQPGQVSEKHNQPPIGCLRDTTQNVSCPHFGHEHPKQSKHTRRASRLLPDHAGFPQTKQTPNKVSEGNADSRCWLFASGLGFIKSQSCSNPPSPSRQVLGHERSASKNLPHILHFPWCLRRRRKSSLGRVSRSAFRWAVGIMGSLIDGVLAHSVPVGALKPAGQAYCLSLSYLHCSAYYPAPPDEH